MIMACKMKGKYSENTGKVLKETRETQREKNAV